MKKLSIFTIACCAVFSLIAPSQAQVELTSNGDFEAGDVSDWTSFPTATSTFAATNAPADVFDGGFSGTIANTDPASAAVVKQANLGIGTVNPGDLITISFWAKGNYANGGVSFAEFFSEVDGGGTSKAEILGGGPLFGGASSATYQPFSFMTTAGPDVSGGVTLQFTATTGGAAGSSAELFIDNVSVSVPGAIPEPGSMALLSLLGLGAATIRRR